MVHYHFLKLKNWYKDLRIVMFLSIFFHLREIQDSDGLVKILLILSCLS
jgi:hypothetical protein